MPSGENNNSGALDPNGEDRPSVPAPIAPISFSPVGAVAVGRNRRVRLLPVLLAVFLLLGAIVLWFLLTARAVTVTSSPPFAQIDFAGGASFALADHYLLRPGQYRLSVSSKGYIDYQAPVTVTDKDRQIHHIALEKLPGHINIVTKPVDATIFIDNTEMGKAPLTVNNITPGDHKLLVKASRFLAVEKTVTVEGLDRTEQVEIELLPGWGYVTMVSDPSGATIISDGEVRGTTPATIPVLASGELVEVTLTDYKPWRGSVSVPVGETRQWPPVKLQPSDGVINLSSDPSGATITVNDQYSGTTPSRLALVPGKNHQLNLFLNGYDHFNKQVTVSSGEQRELNVTLKVKLGTLNITSQPPGADLYIDGKLRGKTPLSLTLPARPWRAQIRKTGFTSQDQVLVPKPGIDQAAHFSLKTEEETRWASILPTVSSASGQELKLFRVNTTFTMGASRREQGRRANEVLRPVSLTRPFYLSTTEVTNAQFRQFKSQHNSGNFEGKTLDYLTQPVVNVDWNSAALYCNWLSKKDKLAPFYQVKEEMVTGTNPRSLGYRLPTEAEWSWAARRQQDGTMLKFPWGSQFPPTTKIANIADRSAATIVARVVHEIDDGHPVSAPVGSYAANDKGLQDMGGNVSEWVNDYYSIAISPTDSEVTDPLGPDKGEHHVIRGASWRHGGISELRLSFRDYGDKARDDLGFRIARYAK